MQSIHRSLRHRARAVVATVAAVFVVAANAGPPSTPASTGIAWHRAASDADVDAAFAAARAAGKPVFVYWGASWCPPCNQLKATLFNRQDFIERSRAFVPVYVDGDSPGAQRLGTRFQVRGYPTTVLFTPAGEEITRLPGEVEAARYGTVLDLAINASRPMKSLVAEALGGLSSKRALTPDDWQMLAFYSWDTDQGQASANNDVARTLARLAAACPSSMADAALRLRLKALAATNANAAAQAGRKAGAVQGVDAAVRRRVIAALADAATARGQADLVVNHAVEIASALAPRPGPARVETVATFDAALQRLQADSTLSRADRMQALIARVDLARIDDSQPMKVGPAPAPALPTRLLADVREATSKADREIRDGYERQAVITSAAYLLERAGLSAASDALLVANLAKSHSPYYLMSALAGNARQRGDTDKALRWYARAWDSSEGPATRLQWGASYVGALVDLAPADEAAIATTTLALWREAMQLPDAFEQRSGRSLQRVGEKIHGWSRSRAHAAAAARLLRELDSLCSGRDVPDRAACGRLLAGRPPVAKA